MAHSATRDLQQNAVEGAVNAMLSWPDLHQSRLPSFRLCHIDQWLRYHSSAAENDMLSWVVADVQLSACQISLDADLLRPLLAF